jgi:deoxyribonuclease V
MNDKLKKLVNTQIYIARRTVIRDGFKGRIRTVSGIDLAFIDDLAVIACVTLNYDTLNLVDKKSSIRKISFPYMPGFLAFREGPLIFKLIQSLDVEPDVFLIDSQGLAHPRFCGCASHVGVISKKPTIGVAKSKLCGEYRKEPKKVGNYAPLIYGSRVVGWVYKSKIGCKPIFISPGHLVSLKSSIQIVAKCIKVHKLPEPLHLAHRLATEERRNLSISQDHS